MEVKQMGCEADKFMGLRNRGSISDFHISLNTSVLNYGQRQLRI